MKYSFTSAANDPLIAAVTAILNPIAEAAYKPDPTHNHHPDDIAKLKALQVAHRKALKHDRATNYGSNHDAEVRKKTEHADNELYAHEKLMRKKENDHKYGKSESVELDEAKAADPANLKSIITNHSALLKKATTPEAKKFHQTAIANAKEKLRALGESIEELDEASDASILNSLGFKNTTRDIAGLAARLDPNSALGKSIATNLGSGYRDDFVKMQKCMQTIEDTWDDITKDLSMSSQNESAELDEGFKFTSKDSNEVNAAFTTLLRNHFDLSRSPIASAIKKADPAEFENLKKIVKLLKEAEDLWNDIDLEDVKQHVLSLSK